jgi:nucleoside-diphosphate kinase
MRKDTDKRGRINGYPVVRATRRVASLRVATVRRARYNGRDMPMERTLVLLKPDAMQRGLAGEIISRLERRGLRIVAMRLFQMDAELARRHYAEHEGKGFYEGLVAYITASPIIAAVFEGTGAVEVVRRTMGVTNPAAAEAGTIRGDLAVEVGRNLIHGSDSPTSARREIELFFDENGIQSYPRDLDRWVFEAPD